MAPEGSSGSCAVIAVDMAVQNAVQTERAAVPAPVPAARIENERLRGELSRARSAR
jgi:hypothetical protein